MSSASNSQHICIDDRLGLLRKSQPSLVAVFFVMCCTCVALVSVHDAILIILNDDVMFEVERNPIGRWLIRLQGGEVYLFVVVKLFTTALVCTILWFLYLRCRRIALPVATVLAILQLALLLYLQT